MNENNIQIEQQSGIEQQSEAQAKRLLAYYSYLRKSQKMTQSELERITGLSRIAINRCENGKLMPTIRSMNKLLAPLGYQLGIVSLDESDSGDYNEEINERQNELEITYFTELAKEEERFSKKKAAELFKNKLLDTLEPGSYGALQTIHKHLFSDIYEFAGQTRTVNFAKGNLRFVPAMYLDAALESIEKMPQSTFDEIVEKYVEMNIAHPFQKGNGRSIRIWLDQILKKELGKVIDWSLVDKDDYLMAMERSPVKDVEIKVLLKAALTDQVNSREMFMKGVDHSYDYEGYSSYRTQDLVKQTYTQRKKQEMQEERE
jgi:cell filamentation protein